jgi:NTP pyrophosphatase (non-canonical NTP hydrolase)
MKKPIDIDTIQTLHKRWTEKNFPDQVADDCFKGVVEEVGELAHADLKKKQGIRGTSAEFDAEARDAVGDIMIYLMGYCTQRGWLLSEVLQDTWEKVVSKRDWVKYPGNGIDN